jgi:predicted RNase H-like HicB family nuclease/predicted RNA binding protein YcfA (HicA-like mRNA interferase family)
MGRFDKLIMKLLRGASDASFAFDDLRYILEKLGFAERIRGSHHIFDRDDVEELVNIQRHGKDAKDIRYVRFATSSFATTCRESRMSKYEVIIYWSDEDQVFVVEVPELPGCKAHGDSHEDALANAKDAMEFWVDRARELGRAIPEPKGRKLMYA